MTEQFASASEASNEVDLPVNDETTAQSDFEAGRVMRWYQAILETTIPCGGC